MSPRVSTRMALKKWKKEHSVIKSLTKTFTIIDAKGNSNKLMPCNDSKLEAGSVTVPSHNRTDAEIIGGSVDAALLKYADTQIDVENTRNCFPKLLEVPFNPIRQWQMTVSRCQKLPQGPDVPTLPELEADEVVNVVMVKGDPETVLKKCSFFESNGKMIEIDETFKNNCKKQCEEYGYHGYRVIAFAMKHFISKANENFSLSSNNYPIDGLIFLGMAAMEDPPKADAHKAIQGFKTAGIKVFMVTGDPPASVLAVARNIGLIEKDITDEPANNQSWKLVTGKTLSSYSDAEWDKLLSYQVVLFAHVTPPQKLQIVQEAQKRKETVAYSGIHTVSAIAAADIGIALSNTSTDLAQDVAGIILTDDNISSILTGIIQGRLMFDNLSLSIAYTLSHLWPEICPVLLTFILEMPLALQPLHILVVDLITDLISSIFLVWESPESNIMPPRNSKKRLVPSSLLLYSYGFAGTGITIGCLMAYLSVFWSYGIMPGDLMMTSEDFWELSSGSLTVTNSVVLNAKDQVYIRQQASAAWLGTLILAQIFHFLLCKTQRISIFQYKLSLTASACAIIIQASLLYLLIYVPFFQEIFEIQAPPSHIWIFGFIVGIYLLVFNEARKYLVRTWPNNKIIAKYFDF